MFEHLNNQINVKKLEYENLTLKTPYHILGAIEVNIEDSYKFSTDSEIMVIDCIDKKNYNFEVGKSDAELLNSMHPLLRGNYLYKMAKNNK